MGISERRERERDKTRAKIVAAARDLFAREGYDAVSMRKIAETIEYSPTAIYVHFKDKEALFRELCSQDFCRLSEVTSHLSAVADPIERIRRVGEAYIEFALKHPNHYRLMFMTAHPHDPPEAALAHRGNPDEDGYAFLKAATAEAIHAGRILPEYSNVELATQTLWAAVHGMVSLQIIKGTDPWIDWRPVKDRARATVHAVLRGIMVNPSELRIAPKARKAGAR